MKCEYGCGSDHKFVLKNGTHSCSQFSAQCPANKQKNSDNAKSRHAANDGSIYKFQAVDVSKSNEASIEASIKKAFVKNSNYSNEFIKPHFMKMQDKCQCSECGISEWNAKPITLELDHISGNNCDNRVENLRLLCPNCHSQTDTFRGRNINSGLVKVDDDVLQTALSSTKNIRQALISVGLTPKGANYDRAQRLLIAQTTKGQK